MDLANHQEINGRVLLQGKLLIINKNQDTFHLVAEEPIVELVNEWNFGLNERTDPVEIIVFNTGAKETPIKVFKNRISLGLVLIQSFKLQIVLTNMYGIFGVQAHRHYYSTSKMGYLFIGLLNVLERWIISSISVSLFILYSNESGAKPVAPRYGQSKETIKKTNSESNNDVKMLIIICN